MCVYFFVCFFFPLGPWQCFIFHLHLVDMAEPSTVPVKLFWEETPAAVPAQGHFGGRFISTATTDPVCIFSLGAAGASRSQGFGSQCH